MVLEWEIQINLIILKISEGDLIFKKSKEAYFSRQQRKIQ
jgi:hypothetical protein